VGVEGRAVPVEGALNVRDLGGLTTTDGRQVLPGLVLRADSLSHLTDAGVATLVDEIGVRLIIDLRREEEIGFEGRGSIADHPVAYTNLSVRATGELRQDVAPDVAEIDLANIYELYVEHSSDSMVRAIAKLADPTNLPAVVHCTVGKDRTGILVAILLDALGVEHDQIVADYAETAGNMEAVLARLRQSEMFREIELDRLPPELVSAEPDTMRRFLTEFTQQHGGAAHWLQAHGLDAAVLEQLRARLLSAR
jgi:protein tyrosine/serine phosphatase